MCIYIYIHTYIYVYIYIHIYSHLHTCISKTTWGRGKNVVVKKVATKIKKKCSSYDSSNTKMGFLLS